MCSKILKATPMTLGRYNSLRDWMIPANNDSYVEGYIVEYDEIKSKGFLDNLDWLPKNAIKELYFKGGFTMGFEDALKALKEGKAVTRKGWNGSGMFAYMVPANAYPANTGVAKSYFGDSPVPYRAYLALKTAQDDVATWTPSGSDILAEDWEVVS